MERRVLRLLSVKNLVIAALAGTVACETGTEPLRRESLVGVYPLILVDGFRVPIDIFNSGELTLRADATYTMLINDEVWDSGTWTVEGSTLRVTATRRGPGETWFGIIQSHSILFPKDGLHNYNDYLFSQ